MNKEALPTKVLILHWKFVITILALKEPSEIR
jgi:hypothetical protein